MPEMLAAYLLPHVISVMGAIGISSGTILATAVAISTGLAYLALGSAAYLIGQAFAPGVPKPEDGKFNLKQAVPPLVYVLGRTKKGGDYVFLEERSGTAHHVTVWAAHHIKGFTEHWLHDEKVALDEDGKVISPDHFVLGGDAKVRIQTRRGANASSAYQGIVDAFPDIWGPDHRGDGLATVYMRAKSVGQEDLMKVFPHMMPSHQAVGEGHDRLIDPRTGDPGYSENIAVFRYWHLTHPVGGKLSREDMYDPDWANAAEVCDETVLNRDGDPEPRYHGGFWFRANNDPVQVGRLMDQAAELVIYERPDGTVGVHPGTYVEPDVRLTAADIISISYDPNRRRASNVLAVRGRYVDPERGFNTTDAAIVGAPYPSEDERTKTVDNQVVQRHNHIQRLQTLAMIRANAPRVRVVAHFEAARQVPYRRFVKVHYPPRLDEAVIEIIDRPTLSLRNLTYEFAGIVLPGDIYPFDAETQEGEPPPIPVEVVGSDVPNPVGFDVVIQQEAIGGGSVAAYALASFSDLGDGFVYELEWEPTSGGSAQSARGRKGETQVRSGYLADGKEYRFRARTWSALTPSDWTDAIILTAVADPVPPYAPTGVGASGGTGQANFTWTAPNSANYRGARIYLGTTASFGDADLVATEYGAPNASDSATVPGLSAGTFYGWVVAINGSGVESGPVATGAITVS